MLHGNILQQEQHRKNSATTADNANKTTKTKGLLAMLAGDKKGMKDSYK